MTSDDTQRQDPPSEALVALAESYGIATTYHSFFGDLGVSAVRTMVSTPACLARSMMLLVRSRSSKT